MAVAQTNAKPRRRRWLLGLGVVIVVAVIAAGYLYLRARQGSVETVAPGPQTVTVTPRQYRITVAGPGTLQPVRSFDVDAEVDGRIASIVEVGTRVEAGEVVATFDTLTFERAVQEAELNLGQAEAQLGGLQASQADSSQSRADAIADAERLVDEADLELTRASEELALSGQLNSLGSVSEEALAETQDAFAQAERELASARADLATLRASQRYRSEADAQDLLNAGLAVEQARLSLVRAQDDLDATAVTAPFTGVVSASFVQEGTRTSGKQALLTLIDDSRLELVTQIDETEIALIDDGMTAELLLDALPERRFVGTVTTVSPVGRIEQNIPVFEVIVEIDNADLALRPGMTAEAEIIVREVASTVTVPSRALQSVRGRSYLQVLQQDGEFVLARVEVVDTVGFNTVLEAELAPGTEVLVPEAAPAAQQTSQQNQRRGGLLPFGRGR